MWHDITNFEFEGAHAQHDRLLPVEKDARQNLWTAPTCSLQTMKEESVLFWGLALSLCKSSSKTDRSDENPRQLVEEKVHLSWIFWALGFHAVQRDSARPKNNASWNPCQSGILGIRSTLIATSRKTTLLSFLDLCTCLLTPKYAVCISSQTTTAFSDFCFGGVENGTFRSSRIWLLLVWKTRRLRGRQASSKTNLRQTTPPWRSAGTSSLYGRL